MDPELEYYFIITTKTENYSSCFSQIIEHPSLKKELLE